MKKIDTQASRIYTQFSATKYGRRLAKKARYNRFRPKGYSIKHWERLLGPDVNNLHHMRQSIRVAQWFIRHENALRPQEFTTKEALLLCITGALHDQAEAIVGDIPHGRKTESQHSRELQVLREYETAFAPHVNGPALLLYRFGRDRIAFDATSQKLPSAFKTIELLGFVRNAAIASRRFYELEAGELTQDMLRFLDISSVERKQTVTTSLERLLAEVLGSGVLGQLIEMGQRYPSAHVYLHMQKKDITAGFDAVKTDTFLWYESGEDTGAVSGERERRCQQFNEQKQLWEKWSNASS